MALLHPPSKSIQPHRPRPSSATPRRPEFPPTAAHRGLLSSPSAAASAESRTLSCRVVWSLAEARPVDSLQRPRPWRWSSTRTPATDASPREMRSGHCWRGTWTRTEVNGLTLSGEISPEVTEWIGRDPFVFCEVANSKFFHARYKLVLSHGACGGPPSWKTAAF